VWLTTLTFATVLAVVKPWGRIRGVGRASTSPGFSAVVSDGVEPVRSHGERPATARSTALEESIMTATYTFDVFTSLDGFGSYSGGNWGGYWGKQGPELLEHRLALYGEEQRMVFGASTYRQFVRLLASSTEESGARDPWVTRMRNLPATVVSTTLQGRLDWPDATVVSGDPADIVARLKEESEVPLRSHGSLSLNRALMAAGLVDRVQVTLFPVITGQTGVDPIFAGAADFDLELIESRTLDGHTQELIYRPTLHV
jgi:dihydrofolate reductase